MTQTPSGADVADAAPAYADSGAVAREGQPAWAAVVSLALGVFGLVTAEFLPASLLTPIADDLGVTDGAAGQAVTATAVIGAFAAPLMAMVTKRFDRRVVMWTLTALLVLSSLLGALAADYVTFLASRLILGVSLGGFWSMAAAMAMRLVPMDLLARAMAIILTGVSVATVLAAPVGASIGDLWGWRAAFLLSAGIGVLALVVQLSTIPRLPPVGAPGFRTLLALLTRPQIRLGLIATLLFASGHFAGFTYFRPFLEQVPAVDVPTISLTLLAFGIGGFLGNFAGAWLVERSVRLALTVAPVSIAAMAGVLVVGGEALAVAVTAIAFWGFAFGAIPVAISNWLTRAAPDEAESAGGLLVATFQVAIAAGAILGGLLVDSSGVAGALVYSALATLLAGVVVHRFGTEPGEA